MSIETAHTTKKMHTQNDPYEQTMSEIYPVSVDRLSAIVSVRTRIAELTDDQEEIAFFTRLAHAVHYLEELSEDIYDEKELLRKKLNNTRKELRTLKKALVTY